MIRPLAFLGLVLLTLAGCGGEAPADGPAAINGSSSARDVAPPPARAAQAEVVRVRLATDAGAITVALDARRAPVTTANFLRYVDAGRFDGIFFYRAARTEGSAGRGFIQGGIRRNYRRMFPPIAHEPTSATGLRHVEGAISMARSDTGAGAMGDFFIITAAMPAMDAHGDEPGYAAFGRVEEGMDIVRRILAAETVPNAGRGAMRGQMIAAPVRIVSVRRVE